MRYFWILRHQKVLLNQLNPVIGHFAIRKQNQFNRTQGCVQVRWLSEQKHRRGLPFGLENTRKRLQYQGRKQLNSLAQ